MLEQMWLCEILLGCTPRLPEAEYGCSSSSIEMSVAQMYMLAYRMPHPLLVLRVSSAMYVTCSCSDVTSRHAGHVLILLSSAVCTSVFAASVPKLYGTVDAGLVLCAGKTFSKSFSISIDVRPSSHRRSKLSSSAHRLMHDVSHSVH